MQTLLLADEGDDRSCIVFREARHGCGRLRVAAITCGIAAGLVLGFNAAWAVAENKLPVPAAIFITVAVVLAAWAARRFLVEAGHAAEDRAGDAIRP